MKNKIPIIVMIDVEPDGFFIDRNKPLPWKGFEGLCPFFSDWRKSLEQATGEKAHFSWFVSLDPQVEETYGSAMWPLTQYENQVRNLENGGDEIGLHPHAYRWEPKNNDWIEDREDQRWVNYCTEMAFAAYKKALNRTCKSFRFGAAWINNETMNLAQRLGAEIDLSIEPKFKLETFPYLTDKKKYIGAYPNFDDVPLFPYQKADHDFKTPAQNKNGNIWVIPQTIGNVQYRYGRLEWLQKRLFAPQLLKPFDLTLKLTTTLKFFIQIVEEQLKRERPYITIALRSDVGQPTKFMKQVINNSHYLATHPLAKQFVFATPQEALKILGVKE